MTPPVPYDRRGVCEICARQSRGFGFCHRLNRRQYPNYDFCSMRCLNLGAELARRNKGVIDKTDMERQAIKAARRPLAEILTELGLMPHFANLTPQQIDTLIEAVVDGFQASMTHQSLNDEIPF